MAKVSDGYQISLTDTEILKILLNFININNRNNYSHNNYYRNLVEFDTIQSTPGHPLFRSNRLNYSKVMDVKPTGSLCMCSTIPIRPLLALLCIVLRRCNALESAKVAIRAPRS